VIFAVLLIGCLLPDVASAAGSPRVSPDPSPRKAPSSPAPTPDPAPEAIARHTTPASTASRSSTSIAPRLVHVTTPTRPSYVPPPTSGNPLVTAHRHIRRVPAHKAPDHHARPATVPDRVSLPFHVTKVIPLTSGLPAGTATHAGDGFLLLLSSLAMAALAVSSFALLRRLKRLGGTAG
jgi:hypothetical protein